MRIAEQGYTAEKEIKTNNYTQNIGAGYDVCYKYNTHNQVNDTQQQMTRPATAAMIANHAEQFGNTCKQNEQAK